jgi:putative DNA primase/helicase
VANLTRLDLEAFARLTIPEELITLAGVERVTDREARDVYGIKGSGDMAGIAFPYFDPETMSNGHRRVYVRIRRDHLEDGKPKKKYVAPYGDRKRLYFPPTPELFADVTVPIVLVEAEKSSLALTAWAARVGQRILPLAMGGVYGWIGKVGIKETATGERVPETGAIRDLNICRDGRRTYVLLDANCASNPKVLRARKDLVGQLRKQGADIRVLELPQGNWNGPDDFIGVEGDKKMLAILAAGGTATDGGEILPPRFSEDALALRFSELYADDLRYVARWAQWLRWDGTRWAEDTTLNVYDLARAICREASAECGENEKATATRLASKSTRAAVESLAQADRRHAATVEQWDTDPWLLNTPTGTCDLRTGELRPHRHEEYITKITASAPSGECPLWLKFLDRVTGGDAELQAFLQRTIGYCLTGTTREHALFFLYGTGANGKSVFLSTISTLLADYAKTAPASTFTASAIEQHPADLASLRGARLVTAIETEDGSRWAESRIKSLTGGDRIAARFMRCNFFEYTPEFKLMIAGNHKPSLRSIDEAIRRRLHLIPFEVTIPEEERDLQLAEKLRAEFSGILQWAIQGCLAWQQDGIKPPACVRAATAAYMASEDHIGQWLDDRCVVDRRCWSPSAALFSDYQNWCQSSGERERSKKRFGAELETRGFEPERTRTARGFRGIGLREDAFLPQTEGDETSGDRCDVTDHYPRTRARAHTSITGARVTSVTKGKPEVN